MISIVVATDKNRVIGRENKIPWRLRDDLVHLRNLTKGHAVILGRKTYDSMLWYYEKSGKPMPGKMYVVVSRNANYDPVRENAMVVHSIDEAVVAARRFDEDVYAIGGFGIFAAIIPQTDRIYLTEVHTHAKGDAFFPELDMSQWRETAREHHKQDEYNEFDYDMITLDSRLRGNDDLRGNDGSHGNDGPHG